MPTEPDSDTSGDAVPERLGERLLRLRKLDFEVASRAALAVAIPLIFLGLIGRFDWAAYAAFGAMTALYGRSESYRLRLRTVSIGAIGLILSVGLGVLLALAGSPIWLVTVVLVVVITAGILVAAVAGLFPPTPLFFVFGLLVCAYLPTPDGEVGWRMLVAISSATLAWFITMAGWFLRRAAGEREEALFKDFSRSTATTAWLPGRLRDGAVWLAIGQSVVGVLIAGGIAIAAGIGHPYWAVVSVLAVIPPPGARHSTERAIHRIIGTAIGVVLTGLILLPDPSPVVLVIAVVLAQFCAEILVGRHYGAALVFVTPLALCVIHLASPAPVGVLLVDRIVETTIGALVAIVLVLLARYVSARSARSV